MSRCQHCKKLTHTEHLYVEYQKKDLELIDEMSKDINFDFAYSYLGHLTPHLGEYGRLKCGDIYIHFVCKKESHG